MRFARGLAATACMLAMALTAARAQDTTGVTKDSITIGVDGPLTGSAAVFGSAVFGNEALFDDVNDHGGIYGRKIKVVQEDDGCDPVQGIAAFRKLMFQDKVFAINAIACSGVAMAVRPDVAATDVPWMVMSAAGDGIAVPTVPNIFQAVPTTAVVARAMVDFALSKPGITKVAFVSHSDDWGKSNHDPAVAYLKSKYHLSPTLDLTMERGTDDATPQILRIRNSGAQVVFLMMYPAEVAIFVRDAYKYGLDIPQFGPMSISLEDTANRVGGIGPVKNLYVFYPYVGPFGSPEMKHWSGLITKYFPDLRIENFAFLGLGGAQTLVKALRDAGPDLSREKLVAALNNIKNYDTGILSGPVTFTPTDHAGVKTGAMATYRNGQIVVLKTWQ